MSYRIYLYGQWLVGAWSEEDALGLIEEIGLHVCPGEARLVSSRLGLTNGALSFLPGRKEL